MKHYFIDEIVWEDVEKIRDFLSENAHPSSIEDLYWVHLTQDILSEVQYDHKGCWPYCFAVELGESSVKFELLIRSRHAYKCSCTMYATPVQRDFIIKFADGLIETLGVQT